MALNELFALDWGWYSYNVPIGEPRLAGSGIDHVESSSIVWTYDNSQNFQEFQANWTGTWTNTTRASLSITNRFTISLSQKISIMNIANSEFAFIIGTDSTREERRESTHELSMLWGLRWLFPLPHYTPLKQLHDSVQGGETVHIERVRMITTGQAIYHQDYGLAAGSQMASA
ncbi:hypothetical protein B0H14DRAFT_3442462 [Mycena olivaceomarginata]|nr:hypothetical protein B0H14DRAFT_3442462 [Mycena olivaceomarginata]